MGSLLGGIEWDALPMAATPCFRNGSLQTSRQVREGVALVNGPGGDRKTRYRLATDTA